MTGTQKKMLFFLIVSALFLLQDQLQDWFTPFQYFDEAFGLLIVPMVIIRVRQKRLRADWTKQDLILYASLMIFWLFGWAGSYVYEYQPLTAALKDSYVNIKFFLTLGGCYLFFDDPDLDFRTMKKKIWPWLNAATLVLFILFLIDLFFRVFSDDTRGGLPAVKIFYSAHTIMVANCVFLSSIYLWYYDIHKDRIIAPLAMLSFMMFWTIRVKSMGAIAAILLIYLLVLRARKAIGKKVKIFAVCVLAFAAAAIIYQFVSYYFTLGTSSARAMLTLASPFIAWDHFPFGSGWGTFGSAFSVEPYSPVYGMYRMEGIWGISRDYHAFVSDTYWPMILGQCGFFGFAALIAALVILVRKILVLKTDRAAMAAAANVLLYLLISSTSESALANPMAVPLAFLLGFLLARHKRRKQAAG